MKTEGNLTSGPQIFRARPAGEVHANMQPVEEILEEMCKQAQRGPVVISTDTVLSVGDIATFHWHENRRLTAPLRLRVIGIRTEADFERLRGRAPRMAHVYEVEGLD